MDEQRHGQVKSLQHRIDQILFNYRNTPTGVTGEAPAQLFLSWKPRTMLSLLHPDIEQRMKEKLERTRQSANRRRGAWRDFEEGEDVLVQGLRPGEGGVVERSLGSPVPIDGARETSDAEQVDEQADDTNKEPVTLLGPSSAGGDCGGGEPQPSQPELRRSTRQRRPPDRY
ncbi:hypothetical protein MTO96_046574 [Rhipicephalus appendiculatus]